MTRRRGGRRTRHIYKKRFEEHVVYNTGNKMKPVSFSKRETMFSDSQDSENGSFGDSLDSDIVTDYVENLELNGENTLQVVDVEKYTELQRDLTPSPNLSISNDTSEEDLSDSSKVDIKWEDYEESDTCSNQVSNVCEAVPSESDEALESFDSEAIHQMTDEEALEYIQYLKQKIQKIKQILKTRSETDPSSERQKDFDLVSVTNRNKLEKSFAKDDNWLIYGLSNDSKYFEEKFSRPFAQSKQRFRRLDRQATFVKENRRSHKKQSMNTLETMKGLDWSQFPISRSGMKKHLQRLYSKMIDDELEYAMNLTSFKKKKRGLSNGSKRNLALQSFRRIRSFLQKGKSKRYTFPSMNRHLRLAIHKFAEACGIPSKSHGKEGRRSVTVCRVSSWKFPQEETIETILNEVGLGSDINTKNKKKIPKRTTLNMASASTHSARGRRELERSLAVDIGEDNIGHRMLQSMGWSKGQSLGHPNREEAGLTQPVQVHIRPPRAGLGSGEGPR
ncbi:hypothetical protein GpartN1_g5888.t1 [Galdieria partita]|uniref:G-patch domain-containing protein n=1 Tax=Galdieria partita TaxID=83374 RepID=A0A9C7Q2Q1_9RHOD|nr:hypothetical protein GpartN1_g5888.t1 [Galdieria partita]